MSHESVTEEPQWQTVEKIVAFLEKTLTPFALVEHNKFLPVIGRPERELRQCDIVITYGQPPRQTITIVEVQDRRRRPDINTFHGWVHKMREVGAQHLICVSVLGFPQSIIDDVANVHGPTIRLLTLQELEEITLPGIVFGNSLIHKKPHYYVEEILSEIKLQPQPSEPALITSEDRVFTLPQSDEKLNLLEVVAKVLTEELQSEFASQGIVEPYNYSMGIIIGSPEAGLTLHIGDQNYVVISLHLKIKVTTEISLIPMQHFEYKQETIDGTLAWVMVAKGEIEGKEIDVKIAFKQDQEGFLRFAAIHSQDVQNLALAIYTDEDSWRAAMGHVK